MICSKHTIGLLENNLMISFGQVIGEEPDDESSSAAYIPNLPRAFSKSISSLFATAGPNKRPPNHTNNATKHNNTNGCANPSFRDVEGDGTASGEDHAIDRYHRKLSHKRDVNYQTDLYLRSLTTKKDKKSTPISFSASNWSYESGQLDKISSRSRCV